MTYDGQTLEIDAIIAMLKQRGMTFANEDVAARCLSVVSYFRLANYMRPMELPETAHKFKPEGSTFENALLLYRFDEELRTLLLPALCHVEVALRTQLAQQMGMRHGAFWFAAPENYASRGAFDDIMDRVCMDLKRSKEDFIHAHKAKYDDPPYPPVWKTLEVVTFGTLSRMYGALSDGNTKKRIARTLGVPNHLLLASWTNSLSALRNCVAHHARVWNRRYPRKPQVPPGLPQAWIAMTSVDPVRLYAQLCCLLYLENIITPSNKLAVGIRELMARYPNVDPGAMGFPRGRQDEAIWQQNSVGDEKNDETFGGNEKL